MEDANIPVPAVADQQAEEVGGNLIESDLSGAEALEQTDGFM